MDALDKQHQKTNRGIRFKVQTVTPSEPLDILTNAQTKEELQKTARDIYSSSALEEVSHVTLEAHSQPERLVRNDSFNTECYTLAHIVTIAFANHYPLILGPEHLWLTITHAAAQHINQSDNAEKLRDKFVSHEGKMTLTVRNDELRMGHIPNHVWENDVFSKFSEQIRENVKPDVHHLFTAPFSATGKAEQAAMNITLMASMQGFFTFEMWTLCGIPWIELTGSRQDWVDLRTRTSKLEEYLLPEFASGWLPHLLPVLDQFILAYDGKVNEQFWTRMCKVVMIGRGSGASRKISGWINNFYPFLQEGKKNRHVKPWQQLSTMEGPRPAQFPMLLSSIPVLWKYLGRDYALHFHAGYMGMTQDEQSLAVSPNIGWMVSHDPTPQ